MEGATVRVRAELELRVGDRSIFVELEAGGTPIALVGPNGSGKTTVLRALVGAHRPHRGRLEVGGRVLFDAEAGVDVPPEARGVGYVPQGRALFPHLGVLENVAFGLRGRASARARRAAALQILDMLGCAHLVDRPVVGLSGGEAQRVSLARALMVEPDLLLLDEPLSALDAGARRELRAFLADRLVERGRPAIVVTHDPRDIRALEATVVVLEDGGVVQAGPWAEVAGTPATPFVAELFEGFAASPDGP